MKKEYLLARLRKGSDEDVMPVYLEDEKQRGYTWFDTDCRIAQWRIDDYLERISVGEKIPMLFMIDYEIAYRAEIMDIAYSRDGRDCPEEPPKFPYEEEEPPYPSRAWIKIHHLMKTKIKVKHLKFIEENEKDVRAVFSEPHPPRQCLFYVSLK